MLISAATAKRTACVVGGKGVPSVVVPSGSRGNPERDNSEVTRGHFLHQAAVGRSLLCEWIRRRARRPPPRLGPYSSATSPVRQWLGRSSLRRMTSQRA